MMEYRRLYAERAQIGAPNSPMAHVYAPQYGDMAAHEIASMDIKRAPSLEAEVRVTAIAVGRLLDYLEDELRYRAEKHERGLT